MTDLSGPPLATIPMTGGIDVEVHAWGKWQGLVAPKGVTVVESPGVWRVYMHERDVPVHWREECRSLLNIVLSEILENRGLEEDEIRIDGIIYKMAVDDSGVGGVAFTGTDTEGIRVTFSRSVKELRAVPEHRPAIQWLVRQSALKPNQVRLPDLRISSLRMRDDWEAEAVDSANVVLAFTVPDGVTDDSELSQRLYAFRDEQRARWDISWNAEKQQVRCVGAVGGGDLETQPKVRE